ncbi:hypothetical protein [Orenia marismortui]|uniref:hypothetical protein n=1 Tax=Orenia marismortui TaxID=46469 RepID=UPI000366FFBD|nr:hypothetical protein [Orenia marismortui]
MNLLAYILCLTGIISLVVIQLIKKEDKDFIEILVSSMSLYLVIISLVSVVFLLFRSYSSVIVLAVSSFLIIIYTIYYLFFEYKNKVKNINLFKLSLGSLLVLGFVITMIIFVGGRYEFIQLTGDAGVYSVSAMNLEKNGKLISKLEVRENLSDELKKIYDKDNLLYFNPNTKNGSYLPGIYLESNSEGELSYYYQFYPVWPIMMSVFSSIFGQDNQHYILVVFYVLLVFLLYYSLIKIGISKLYSFMGVILLGTSPLVIHFAKYPTSELFLLFLVMYCFYAITQNNYHNMIIAGLIITVFSLTHISTFMYLPILLLGLVFIYQKRIHHYFIFLITSFSGFLISIPYGYYVSKRYFLDIYNMNFARFYGEKSLQFGILTVTFLGGVGLIFSLIGFFQKYNYKGELNHD